MSNKGDQVRSNSGEKERVAAKQTVMEKQVTLEEQMICGALQTLNEEAMEDVLEETEDPNSSLQVPEAGEGVRPRQRTLSQSSYVDVHETDVLFLQQSHWTPAPIPTPAGSATSSLANTPVQQRRSRDTKTTGLSRSQPGSRPVSLLVAVPGEEDSLFSHGSDGLNQGIRQPANSTLMKVASTLLDHCIPPAPAVTITPAASVDVSDEESTPLMSELSTPTHVSRSNPLSSDLSPTTDGPQHLSFQSICDDEILMTTQLLHTVSRQDEFEREEEAGSLWGDPETTV